MLWRESGPISSLLASDQRLVVKLRVAGQTRVQRMNRGAGQVAADVRAALIAGRVGGGRRGVCVRNSLLVRLRLVGVEICVRNPKTEI